MAERTDGRPFGWENPYTQAGFTMIPNTVMLRHDLSPTAKLLYGYMGHLAWRSDSVTVAPAKETLCNDFALSENTITAALKELKDAPLIEGDGDDALRLIVVTRRGQGNTNAYTLRNPWETRTADSAVQDPHDLRNLARARSSSGTTRVDDANASSNNAGAMEQRNPPPGVEIDGQNLPLNALCAVTGVDRKSPRLQQAVVALNGRIDRAGKVKEPGIRHLYWIEAVRWAEAHDQLDRLVLACEDAAAWSRTLAARIEQKGERYRTVYSGAAISPQALRNHWLDLELAPTAGGGLSADDIERFTDE